MLRKHHSSSPKKVTIAERPYPSNQELIPIYTAWANHQLSKTKLKPITDLSSELCYPKTLVGLIHAISNDCRGASKETLLCALNSTEPVESIEKCLRYLAGLGVQVSSIQATDILNGHLGAILSLLFSLSYFKQQQKAVHRLLSADSDIKAPTSSSKSERKPSLITTFDSSKAKKSASHSPEASGKRRPYLHSKTTNCPNQSSSSGYSSVNYVTFTGEKSESTQNLEAKAPVKANSSAAPKRVAFRMPPDSSSNSNCDSMDSPNSSISTIPQQVSQLRPPCGSNLRAPSALASVNSTGKSALPCSSNRVSKLVAPSSTPRIPIKQPQPTVVERKGEAQTVPALPKTAPPPLPSAKLGQDLSSLSNFSSSLSNTTPDLYVQNDVKRSGIKPTAARTEAQPRESKLIRPPPPPQRSCSNKPPTSLRAPSISRIAQRSAPVSDSENNNQTASCSSVLRSTSTAKPNSDEAKSEAPAILNPANTAGNQLPIINTEILVEPKNSDMKFFGAKEKSAEKQHQSSGDSDANNHAKSGIRAPTAMGKSKISVPRNIKSKISSSNICSMGSSIDMQTSQGSESGLSTISTTSKVSAPSLSTPSNSTFNVAENGGSKLPAKAVSSPHLSRNSKLQSPKASSNRTTTPSSSSSTTKLTPYHINSITQPKTSPNSSASTSSASLIAGVSLISDSTTKAPPPSLVQSSASLSSSQSVCEKEENNVEFLVKVRDCPIPAPKTFATSRLARPGEIMKKCTTNNSTETQVESMKTVKTSQIEQQQMENNNGIKYNSPQSSANDAIIGEKTSPQDSSGDVHIRSLQQEKRPVLAVKGISMNSTTDNCATEQQVKPPSSSGMSQTSQMTCLPLNLTPVTPSQATVVGIVSPMLHKVDSLLEERINAEPCTSTLTEEVSRRTTKAFDTGYAYPKTIEGDRRSYPSDPSSQTSETSPNPNSENAGTSSSRTNADSGDKKSDLVMSEQIVQPANSCNRRDSCPSPVPPPMAPPIISSIALHRNPKVTDAVPKQEKVKSPTTIAPAGDRSDNSTHSYSNIRRRIPRDYTRDSYEDSSSISSSVSETFDDISTDDLTGSSSDYLPGRSSACPPLVANTMPISEPSTSRGNCFPDSKKPNHIYGNISGGSRPQIGHYLSNQLSAPQNRFSSVSYAGIGQNSHNHQQSVDELLQKCRTSQRGVAFHRNEPNGATNAGHQMPMLNPRQLQPADYYHQLQQRGVFDASNHIARPYHTIHAPPSDLNPSGSTSEENSKRMAPPRILSPPPSHRGQIGLLSDDGEVLTMTEKSGKPNGKQCARLNQYDRVCNSNGRDVESLAENESPSLSYHTHSLDRHSHLRIFSLSSAGNNGLGGGELLSAPSSPYRGLPVPSTIRHQRQNGSDKDLRLLASPRQVRVGMAPNIDAQKYCPEQIGSSDGRHSVSASANHYRTQRLLQNPCYEPRHNLGHAEQNMSRSMVLLYDEGSGETFDPEKAIANPGSSLRRMSPHVGRQRVPLSVAPQRIVSLEQENSLYAGSNNRGRRGRNGSLSARASNEQSLGYPHYHSASSSIYASHGANNGLHLHKLSSSQPTPDFISASNSNGGHNVRASPADSNIYLNFRTTASPQRVQQFQNGGQIPQMGWPGNGGHQSMDYVMDCRKLMSEMNAYRATVAQMSVKNHDYNQLIHVFNTRLNMMVKHVERLQQKSNLKQEEVDSLRQEIEQLRRLTCNAGVNIPQIQCWAPSSTSQDGAGEQLLNRHPSMESVASQRSNVSKFNSQSVKESGEDKQNSRGSKKSWIRSSFSRAFHKAGSSHMKKSKGSSGAISDVEHSPMHTPRSQCAPNQDNIRGKSATRLDSVASDTNQLIPLVEVVQLKKQLEDKDLALTDVRLDALDKAREVDLLRETVHRLKNENKMLKQNFSLLERRIRDDSRASSHQSLSTCCHDNDSAMSEPQPTYDLFVGGSDTGSASAKGGSGAYGHSLAESRCNSVSSKRSSSGLSVRVSLCLDLSGTLDFPSSTTCNWPSSSAITSLQSGHSLSSPHISGSSSTISSTASSSLSNPCRRELTIGHLAVPTPHCSWEDMDQRLGLLLEEYLHRIDPDMALGVDSYSSIVGYQIIINDSSEETCVIRSRNEVIGSRSVSSKLMSKKGSTAAENLSPADVITSTALIRIRLSGVLQNSMDALVLESLFPKPILEQLLNTILHSRRLIIYGPTGIGKSNLARFLAKYLAAKLEMDAKNLVDIRFPDDDKYPSKVEQVQQKLLTILKSQNNGHSVVLLDNIQRKRIDLLTAAFAAADKNKANVFGLTSPEKSQEPFVIVTLNRTSESPVQSLQLHHNFRLFSLNAKMDAVKGYMGRYLRRRSAEEELGGSHSRSTLSSNANEQLQSVIAFLSFVLEAVNDFIETANAVDVTLGPRIFLQCPLYMDESRRWFVELWNEKIVPYMSKVASESLSFLGSRGILKDPTPCICEQWPWVDGCHVPEILRHVSPAESTDSGINVSANGSHKSSNTTLRSNMSEIEVAKFPAAVAADFDPIYALERLEESRTRN
ncbi:neuron navigator 1 [Ditylenchus destructor]|nr:neuron navigator 1 [Ditylenchus destructor]